MGVGGDGCTRQLSRLFTREGDRPSASNRKLVILVGDDRDAFDYFAREFVYFDLVAIDTTEMAALSPSKSGSMHGRVRVKNLNHAPCILHEFGVQPHVIFVQQAKENLQVLTNVWDKTSRTPKSKRTTVSCAQPLMR
jgi:hypothetical protein